ncbi:MAG: type I-E CRISPR-associated protein Cas6/Cse3/CasE [Rhodocyclaceae bacterium]|nr:type I-E CRISPR-associated protein Cas6/Cse3/CasE [Rhodocyclaceae bacterium]
MSHFFSRVHLDRQGLDRQQLTQLAAGSAYFEHALVWRLFPGDGEARDFVFRVDRDRNGWPTFLIVSRRPPLAVPGLLEVEVPKPYTPRLSAGELVQFTLRANPTEATEVAFAPEELAAYNARRQASGKAPRDHHPRRTFHDVIMAAKKRLGHPLAKDAAPAQRVALEDAADLAARDWFLKRAEGWGLAVQNRESWLDEDEEPALEWDGYTQHSLPHKGGKLAFSSLDYQGLARVSDSEKLTEALIGGIGRAKAFGCGLLLVRRV